MSKAIIELHQNDAGKSPHPHKATTVSMTLQLETDAQNLSSFGAALLFFLKQHCAQIELRQPVSSPDLFPSLDLIPGHPIETHTWMQADDTGQVRVHRLYEAGLLQVVRGYNDNVLEY